MLLGKLFDYLGEILIKLGELFFYLGGIFFVLGKFHFIAPEKQFFALYLHLDMLFSAKKIFSVDCFESRNRDFEIRSNRFIPGSRFWI